MLVNTNFPVVTNIQLKEKTAHSVIISDFIVDVLIRGSPYHHFCQTVKRRNTWGNGSFSLWLCLVKTEVLFSFSFLALLSFFLSTKCANNSEFCVI